MNIILFGPPGVGKSTLIGILKSHGQRAIDLEDVYPNKIRFQLPNLLQDAFIGAADLNPARKYHGAIKVLLFADQDVYDARRLARDNMQPGKGNQAHHDISNWMKGAKYDFLLDTTRRNPERTASVLISLMKGDKS